MNVQRRSSQNNQDMKECTQYRVSPGLMEVASIRPYRAGTYAKNHSNRSGSSTPAGITFASCNWSDDRFWDRANEAVEEHLTPRNNEVVVGFQYEYSTLIDTSPMMDENLQPGPWTFHEREIARDVRKRKKWARGLFFPPAKIGPSGNDDLIGVLKEF